jgi:hypothetical protein
MRNCAIIHPLHLELETAPDKPNEQDQLAAFFSILIVIKQRKGTGWEIASK